MASFNSINLVGNVGQDPRVKAVGDKKVAEFTLATSHGSGERKETDWHNIVVWSPRAENVERYVRKGKQLLVQGTLQYRMYVNSAGATVKVAEVIANNVVLLDGRPQDNNNDDLPAF